MNGFEAYSMFLALKQHFTSDHYDFVTYGGETTATTSAYNRRKDKFVFVKLAEHKDVFGYLLANFVDSEFKAISNIYLREGDAIYTDWLRRKESLTYVFTCDIKSLPYVDNFNQNFAVLGDEYPIVLKMLMRKEICIETVVILDALLGLFSYWDKKISDPYIYPTIARRCRKYARFLEIDKDKYRKIVLDTFSEKEYKYKIS